MILIKIISIINYFQYEYYIREKCLKYHTIYFFIFLFFSLCILEFIKRQKLKKKLEILSIDQQEIIKNYFINISSDFENEKYSEMNNLASLFSLKNYSELSNEALKKELKVELYFVKIFSFY